MIYLIHGKNGISMQDTKGLFEMVLLLKNGGHMTGST